MKFYRYEAMEYAVLDHTGDFVAPNFPNPKIELKEYILIKETNKGYWIGIENWVSWKKWIPKVSRSRFAYPTREEALNNFIRRTEKRIKILERQIKFSKVALMKSKKLTKPT